MVRRQRVWIALCVVPALLAALASAQEPKAGKFAQFESLGIEFKMPSDWESIPPSPNEKNLILKFDPPTVKYVELGKTGKPLFLHCWLLKFDRRKSPEAEGEKDKLIFSSSIKDLKAWIASGEAGPSLKMDGKPKETDVNKIPASEVEYFNDKNADESFRVYTTVYKLEPDVEVALVFNGPADARKWPKYERCFEEMAKSMRRLKPKDPPKVGPADPSTLTLRERTRLKLEAKLKDTPEWKLYQTEHYFFISNNEDRAFIDELMGRAEAIHSIYEQDYPPEKVKELRKLGEAQRTKDQKEGKEEKPQDFESAAAKALMGNDDPQERAKCSVVRVCKNRDQYHSYGGPGGSAGYWNWTEEELVLYDDKAEGGRGDTWSVLNHEGFHQYIFYFFGNLSPHSWYNEGTGDFYSGYEYKAKRFKLEKFKWRTETIKEAVKKGEGAYVPLKDFVRYSQAEYYGQNKLGIDGGQNYAQGWSFIYFLRTGKKNNAKGWDPKWDSILETYLRTLAMSGSTDQAVEQAFNGIDMDALEKAWVEYTR